MKKLFTNDKFFLAVTLIAVIGSLTYGIICSATDSVIPYMVITNAFCVFAVYFSYQKHSKNIMKGMMGALLMCNFLNEINNLQYIESSLDKVFYPICAYFAVIIFINHFIINAERNASPLHVKINQAMIALYTIATLVWIIRKIPANTDTLECVSDVAYAFAFPCIMAVIVCVESRLDAYRRDRENAGWTEETGYPEGYVHEYQKKK